MKGLNEIWNEVKDEVREWNDPAKTEWSDNERSEEERNEGWEDWLENILRENWICNKNNKIFNLLTKKYKIKLVIEFEKREREGKMDL